MSEARTNVHATALVVSGRGFLFIGPSGSGKTALALTCLAEAEAQGFHAALVGDDQVFLSRRGERIIAETPDAIAGLAEVRGADIVTVPAIAIAVMDFAVHPISADAHERLSPEAEFHDFGPIGRLPLLRLPINAPAPLYLLRRLVEARFQP